jgi:methyl-accepting chemotaxis protein
MKHGIALAPPVSSAVSWRTKMSWLNNLKIVYKLGLILALLTVVIAGTLTYAISRMRIMDDANTDMVTRVDKATTSAARASRRVEKYLSSAFQLAIATTDAGNAKYKAINVENQRGYEELMVGVLTAMPEKAAAIEAATASFKAAFSGCAPGIAFAATTTTPEDSLKASARLSAECVPLVETAVSIQAKLVDDFIAGSAKKSDQLTEEAGIAVRNVILTAVIGLLFSLAVALWIGIKGMSQPIAHLKTVMEGFARGDLSSDVPGTERRDELGEMARTVEIFKTNAIDANRAREDRRADEKRGVEQRKAEMNKLASDFEGAVGEIIETVSSSSTQLEASANTLTATAERAQHLTSTVAAASEEASTNVQSVASSTEEMASSVNEISRQVQESSRIASEAVEQAKKTNDRVAELAKAASRIGDVVELINTIAGQTNLLALNATIEAARAGEAGRGFAVVASEVKALAEQTAKATGEIGQQITGIQAATRESVGAIKEIGETIGRMSEISSTIASAVEEQGAATQEISRNVQQAAHGTQQVSSNISDVQRGASETGSASSQVLSAAQSLSRDSNRLKAEVSKFLNTVRAA